MLKKLVKWFQDCHCDHEFELVAHGYGMMEYRCPHCGKMFVFRLG